MLLSESSELSSEVNVTTINRYTEYLLRFSRRLIELSADIRKLASGIAPHLLISDEQIKAAGISISNHLRKWLDDYVLIHYEPEYFHQERDSVVAYKGNDSDVWIALKFSVSLNTVSSKLYHVDVFPVPVSDGRSDATEITGLPEYVVVQKTADSGVRYAPVTRSQLYECSTNASNGASILCRFSLVYSYIENDSCLSALIQDDTDKIYDTCEFLYYRGHIEASIDPLSDTDLLFYKVDKVTLTCGKYGIFNQKGCDFCIFHMPCNCELHFGNESFASVTNIQYCSSNVKSFRQFHFNLAAFKAFNESLDDEIKASTYFTMPNSLPVPQGRLRFLDQTFEKSGSADHKTANQNTRSPFWSVLFTVAKITLCSSIALLACLIYACYKNNVALRRLQEALERQSREIARIHIRVGG